jgi:imidazoleglycerol phosphate synthase glutamine amidotransferase subunit HisH
MDMVCKKGLLTSYAFDWRKAESKRDGHKVKQMYKNEGIYFVRVYDFRMVNKNIMVKTFPNLKDARKYFNNL